MGPIDDPVDPGAAGGADVSPAVPAAAPHQAFLGLPADKQEAIRQACIKEFVEHGYRGASTNHIVENAGISKGLLFHYFGSKKELFLYLFDHTTEWMYDWFMGEAGDPADWPRDIFERMNRWSISKVRMFQRNPLSYRFLFEAHLNFPRGLEPDMAERVKKLNERGFSVLYKDLDLSVFRPGLDPRKVIELITIAMNGLGEKYMAIIRKSPDPDRAFTHTEDIIRDLREYQEILKVGMYRPGEAL